MRHRKQSGAFKSADSAKAGREYIRREERLIIGGVQVVGVGNDGICPRCSEHRRESGRASPNQNDSEARMFAGIGRLGSAAASQQVLDALLQQGSVVSGIEVSELIVGLLRGRLVQREHSDPVLKQHERQARR